MRKWTRQLKSVPSFKQSFYKNIISKEKNFPHTITYNLNFQYMDKQDNAIKFGRSKDSFFLHHHNDGRSGNPYIHKTPGDKEERARNLPLTSILAQRHHYLMPGVGGHKFFVSAFQMANTRISRELTFSYNLNSQSLTETTDSYLKRIW